MPDRDFSRALKALGTVSLGSTSAEENAAISRLIEAGLTADSSRAGWLERQRRLTRLRFGIREPKTFPWKGASNLAVPLIDAQIRRYKPLLMRLVVEADPVVEFVGEDAQAVDAERVAEAEYNWLFKQHMSATESLAYIIDAFCHRGFAIAQVGWDYQTEYECRLVDIADLLLPNETPPTDVQGWVELLATKYNADLADTRTASAITTAAERIMAGDPFVRIALKRVVADRPALWDRDPVQVIVPPRTTDYGNAEYIIVQHLLSDRQVKQREADGFFDRGTYSRIAGLFKKNASASDEPEFSTGAWTERTTRDNLEQIFGHEDPENILLWEIYHWHDIDGDGLLDRTVTWVHPRTKTKCSSRPYPYPFRRWPFVKFDFEKTSRRFHSPRGISGMLEHVQRETNATHNARLDGMALRNAPVYQMPVMGGFKARNFRVIPGTVLQLPMGAQLTPVMQDRGSFPEYLNEENYLRNLGETYVGNFDNAVMSQGGSRRTATEINAAVSLAASTSSLDAILFQLAMKEVHTMLWELWLEFRPRAVSYKLQGLDPENPDGQFVTTQKGEIDKKFKLMPTGTIANTNRALELSNAKEALSFFAADQTGFINPYELRRWYFTLLDFRRARRVMNAPQQAQHLQVLMQAAAELQQDPNLVAQLGSAVYRPNLEAPPTEVDNTARVTPE